MRAFTILFALIPAFYVSGQIIPAGRLVQWIPGSTVGVSNGIPHRTSLINVTDAPYNADNTGVANTASAIQSAINAAVADQVIYFPAGEYRVKGAVTLKSFTSLRGDGTNTVLKVYNHNSTEGDPFKISFYTSAFWEDASAQPQVTGGATNGSTLLQVSDTSGFTVGYLIQVVHMSSRAADPNNQYDNPIEVTPWGESGGFGWVRRQKTRLVAKTASTLTIWPPLCGDLTNNAVRVIPHSYPGHGWVGIESMTIDLDDSTNVYAGITFGGVMNCWISNVTIHGTYNYNVVLSDSLQCEIRDSNLGDLNHGFGSSGSVVLMANSSRCLIENNIIVSSNSCVEVDSGCAGNVFGYNYVINKAGALSLNANHGPHNTYNLYEGNVVTAFINDGYHGSGSHDTVFRNWLHGQGTGVDGPSGVQIGYELALKRWTRNYSVVGNILGSPAPFTMSYDGTSFGQPNIGNPNYTGEGPPWADWGTFPGPEGFQELDTNVLQTLIRVGNYDFYTDSIPAGEAVGGQTISNSLYLSAKPDWFGDLTWPPFDSQDLRADLGYTNIPAGMRYAGFGVGEGGGPPAPASNLRARIRRVP